MSEKVFEVTEHGGIDPEAESPRLVAKHLAAYHFAGRFARGDVLEIGSGDGYGASLLADGAHEVTGIDLFDANVSKASLKYPKPNLKFLQMSGTDLQFAKHSFDTVVSFQVIEHIPEPLLPQFIGEMKKILRPGGKICLSTLNLEKNRKPGQPYDKSPHHDKEFAPVEFGHFLKGFFEKVEVYGLYPTVKHACFEKLKKTGIFKFLPAPVNPVDLFYQRITVKDFKWVLKPDLKDCIDMLAVCHG